MLRCPGLGLLPYTIKDILLNRVRIGTTLFILVGVQVALTLLLARNVLTNGTVASSFTVPVVCTYDQPVAEVTPSFRINSSSLVGSCIIVFTVTFKAKMLLPQST